MPEVSPAAHALARYMLLDETGERLEPAALAAAVERADIRLRARLVDLIGLAGYTTLVARAVRLAQAEVPALTRVTVDTGVIGGAGAEGTLRGVRDFVEVARVSDADPRAAEAGVAAILAHIIGLLIIFIGEDLALRLVREAWPAPAPDLAASEGRV